MAALFACTKCHSRHPFEELSGNDQICKTCRATNTAVKCIYCRTEFQNDSKEVQSPVCKSCAKNIKLHGKPKACEYCKEMAAFVGMRCQHCTHQERKYGAPHTCNRCKNTCAFDRGPEYKKSMGDQLLCWQCIVSHKRSKMRQRDSASHSLLSASSKVASSASSQGNTPYTPPNLISDTVGLTMVAGVTEKKGGSPAGVGGKIGGGGIHKSHSVGDLNGSSGSSHLYRVKTVLKTKDSSSSSTASPLKRPRLDNSVTNGASSSGRSSSAGVTNNSTTAGTASLDDYSGADQVIMVTQLRELVEAQKKQLLAKDQLIIQKEQKITELKAQHFELEKQLRTRLQTLQQDSDSTIETLQFKNRELQKQVQSQTKSSKRSSAFNNAPLV